MRRRASIAIFLAVASLPSFGCIDLPVRFGTKASFSVRVLTESGEAVSGLSVELVRPDGKSEQIRVTNTGGTAVFERVPRGEYALRAIGEFKKRTEVVVGAARAGSSLELRWPRFPTARARRIAGRVLPSDVLDADAASPRSIRLLSSPTADPLGLVAANDGSFDFGIVAPGHYFLRIGVEGQNYFTDLPVEVFPGAAQDAFNLTFSDLPCEKPVLVNCPPAQPAVLVTSSTAVRLGVVDPAGALVVGAAVALQTKLGSKEQPVARSITTGGGLVQIGYVAPGEYWLTVAAQGFRGTALPLRVVPFSDFGKASETIIIGLSLPGSCKPETVTRTSINTN